MTHLLTYRPTIHSHRDSISYLRRLPLDRERLQHTGTQHVAVIKAEQTIHTQTHHRQGVSSDVVTLTGTEDKTHIQGDHSFSTMIFHDFSITKKRISTTYRHSIFFRNK